MTDPIRRRLAVAVIAIDPPFSVDHGVLFGLQVRREVEDPVPAVETTEFDAEVEVRDTDAARDFAGPSVHGRRGDRFA